MVWWFVQNTVYLGAGVLALTLICKGRWFSPAMRHALWVLVLIKMLMPAVIVWPWSISWPSGHALATATFSHTTATPKPAVRVEYVESFVDLTQVAPPNQPQHSTRTSPSDSRNAAQRATSVSSWPREHSLQQWQWLFWASCLWICGGAVAALLICVRTIRLWRWIYQADKAPSWLVDDVTRLARVLGMPPPQVLVSSRLTTPLVWGIAKPIMIWPAHLVSRPTGSLWEGVVVHELAHLKRGDHWVGVLEILATLVWWWNPLLWYVRHQVHENAELACDCWVVATLPQGRRAYAEAILDICQSVTRTVVPVPACGVRRGPRRSLERRLAMILRERVHFRIPRAGLLAITLLALLTLPSWSQTQDTGGGSLSDSFTPQLPTLQPNIGDDPGNPSAGGSGLEPAAGPAAGGSTGAPSDTYSPMTGAAGPMQSPEQLQGLEQQLMQLLDQVRALQAAQTGSMSGMPGGGGGSDMMMGGMPGMSGASGMMGSGMGMAGGMSSGGMGSMMSSGGPQGIEVVESVEVRVYRTTYRLPEEKAHAVQQFVKQNFVSEVETRVDGNTLVVLTHSSQDEETMRRFIYLMVGAAQPPQAGGGIAPMGAGPVGGSLPPDILAPELPTPELQN